MRRPSAIAVAATLAALLLTWTAAQAEVYRWVDKEGVVHYTDRPPAPGAKPVELPPLQTISGGIGGGPANTPGAGPGLQKPAPTPSVPLKITAPAPDETFRSAERVVDVTVALQRPLPPGAGILYTLDGNVQNSAPSASASFRMEGVERGSHLIGATAVDGNGREIGRASPVIVHMKPPSVK